MEALYDFLQKHAIRGDCQCGRCFDAPADPTQPNGHTANVVFFKIAAKDAPDAALLRKIIQDNRKGDWCEMDPLDGKEHGYMELGGWIGDQGAALTLIGLGSLMGLWKLLTPYSVLGLREGDPLAMQLAGNGLVSIRAQAKEK